MLNKMPRNPRSSYQPCHSSLKNPRGSFWSCLLLREIASLSFKGSHKKGIEHLAFALFTVLKSARAGLGQNYPKPIIEIDLARKRLTEAIFMMREKDVATKVANSNRN